MERILIYLLFALLTGYVAAFSIINFMGFSLFSTADIYADTIIARYMWEQKTLFPNNWVFGNQYYVIATPVLSALFYSVTGSVNISMALATTGMTALILASLAWLLWPFVDKTQLICAVTLFTSSIICVNVAEKMEAQIFFIMASYYACYVITAFIVWGDYARSLFRHEKRTYGTAFILGLMLSFCLGMQSLRQTAVMVLPLVVYEGFRLFKQFLRHEFRVDQGNLSPGLKVVSVMLANIGGWLLMRWMKVPSVSIYGDFSWDAPSHILEKLLTCLSALGSISGLRYAESLSPGWFIALYSLLMIGLVVFALFNTLSKRGARPIGFFMEICALSIAVVLASTLLLKVQLRGIYLFMWYFGVCISFVQVLSMSGKKIQRGLIVLLCIFSAANLYVSYEPGVRLSLAAERNLRDDITDWMVSEDYTFLYGKWHIIGEIASASDGKVTAGAWNETLYKILPYLNTLDIYSEADNTRAVYLFLPSEKEQALQLALQRGIKMTQVNQFGHYEIYTSAGQLMHE